MASRSGTGPAIHSSCQQHRHLQCRATLSGSASGLSLTGSTMFKFDTIVGANLGSVSFTTGAFTSGDAQNGGTLAAGGTFTITGNGSGGVPNGVIFSGTFSSATWTMETLSDGTHNYILSGALIAPNGQVGRPLRSVSTLARPSSVEAQSSPVAIPTSTSSPFPNRAL